MENLTIPTHTLHINNIYNDNLVVAIFQRDDMQSLAATQTETFMQTIEKLEQDIYFLKDKISVLREQRRPNNNMLRTFEQMLTNRENVLGALQQQTKTKAG